MSKLFYIVYKSFADRKFNNLILMVQILISLVTVNLTIGTIQQSNYILKVTDNPVLSNAVYFSALPRIISAQNNKTDFVDERISGMNDVAMAGKSSYIYATFPKTEQIIKINIYSNELIKNLKLPLRKGEWFYDLKSKENICPMVISKALSRYYKVGDIVEIDIENGNLVKGTAKVKVVGIFDNSNFMLRLGAGGDILSLKAIFEKNEYFAIMPQENNNVIEKLQPYDEFGRLLFLKDNTQATYERVISELKDIGMTHKISSMKEVYNASIQEKLLQQFVLCFIIFILALSGIGGNNTLMQIFREKEFAIYFTCGMDWNKCILLTFLNNIIVLIIPSIIAYFVLTNTSWNVLRSLIINMNNLLFSIGIIALIFVITSIHSLYILHKTEPITIIRRCL